MVISQAKLNTMGRDTPTAIAERTYAARGPKMTMGPSGMPIPRVRMQFRMTEDGPLLDRLAKTALGAHQRRTITEADEKRVTEILVADVERRYPVADMAVLARYGMTKRFEAFVIRVRGQRHASFHRLKLPSELALPVGGNSFSALEVSDSTPLIPDAARWYFDALDQLAEVREAYVGFDGITRWPAKFKAAQQRPPMWGEIEAAFPILGNWLADERAKMEQPA